MIHLGVACHINEMLAAIVAEETCNLALSTDVTSPHKVSLLHEVSPYVTWLLHGFPHVTWSFWDRCLPPYHTYEVAKNDHWSPGYHHALQKSTRSCSSKVVPHNFEPEDMKTFVYESFLLIFFAYFCPVVSTMVINPMRWLDDPRTNRILVVFL